LVALYAMKVWTRSIFDGLEPGDGATVLCLSAICFPLSAGSVCLMLVQLYARMGSQRRWRA
jgi:putative ATP-binding cassette transporter